MQVKKTLIAVIVGVAILAFVISRTTDDFDAAIAKMSTAETQYMDRRLMKVERTMSRDELKRLLGTPRTELSFRLEWEGPSWSRTRVFFSDDGREITRVNFRKIGSFDIDFRPWELGRGG